MIPGKPEPEDQGAIRQNRRASLSGSRDRVQVSMLFYLLELRKEKPRHFVKHLNPGIVTIL